ncbi:MAG: HAMP domain-containing histidine kinase [Oscillatoriales cyanobacterium RM2_1_1]|nr:HAMP domain-containing histidine kinase [Oscillatoriales cyanobacterium SM2_3_0]NJO45396.1 HAMP domain-containing histidine kinase [Oscillatoriales cyanobacterium RM2_1_1]
MQFIQIAWKWLSCQIQFLTHPKPHLESTDYLIWRRQFLRERLRLGLWLGLFWTSLSGIYAIYYVVFEFEQLQADFLKFHGDASIAEKYQAATFTIYIAIISVLIICLIGQRTSWGQRYPAGLFLIFACSLNQLIEQIICTFFDIPIAPDTLIFLAIAVLIPVHWRLHLISQALPITYYAVVYPLIGLITVGDSDTYALYSIGRMIEIAWVCSVSNLSVYLYERLKQSEFVANRQLQMLIHSVSHDLKAPVIGTATVLKRLLNQTTNESTDEIQVERSTLDRLLQGSDRQLMLIDSLLEAHRTEVQGIILHCEPMQLKPVVDSVLVDLQHGLVKKRIRLVNQITNELPLVNADACQVWRVLSNLIGNVLKHNPHGIELILDATVLESRPDRKVRLWRNRRTAKTKQLIHAEVPMLFCIVQDNGVGIAPELCQRLFEPYSRGFQARYMPGVGMGLYICEQIITAHGGKIGVISSPQNGSTFWFTLPLNPI